MFPLAYQPSQIGFCDFTKVKRVEITLRGDPFPHLLFHDRLDWLGLWPGDSRRRKLCGSLRRAAERPGGLRGGHGSCARSASAASRDGSYALDITPRYQALCAHDGLSPNRNNRGVAHENGIVEAPQAM